MQITKQATNNYYSLPVVGYVYTIDNRGVNGLNVCRPDTQLKYELCVLVYAIELRILIDYNANYTVHPRR